MKGRSPGPLILSDVCFSLAFPWDVSAYLIVNLIFTPYVLTILHGLGPFMHRF